MVREVERTGNWYVSGIRSYEIWPLGRFVELPWIMNGWIAIMLSISMF